MGRAAVRNGLLARVQVDVRLAWPQEVEEMFEEPGLSGDGLLAGVGQQRLGDAQGFLVGGDGFVASAV